MRFANCVPDPDFVPIDQFPEPFVGLEKMHRRPGIYADSSRLGVDFRHFEDGMPQSSMHVTGYSWDIVSTFRFPSPIVLGAIGSSRFASFRLKRDGSIARFGGLLKLQYAIFDITFSL